MKFLLLLAATAFAAETCVTASMGKMASEDDCKPMKAAGEAADKVTKETCKDKKGMAGAMCMCEAANMKAFTDAQAAMEKCVKAIGCDCAKLPKASNTMSAQALAAITGTCQAIKSISEGVVKGLKPHCAMMECMKPMLTKCPDEVKAVDDADEIKDNTKDAKKKAAETAMNKCGFKNIGEFTGDCKELAYLTFGSDQLTKECSDEAAKQCPDMATAVAKEDNKPSVKMAAIKKCIDGGKVSADCTSAARKAFGYPAPAPADKASAGIAATAVAFVSGVVAMLF